MAAQWGGGLWRGAGARSLQPRLWMRDGALEKKGCMSSAHCLNRRHAAMQIHQQDGKSDTFLRSTTPGSPYGILQSASHAFNTPAMAVATLCAAGMSESDIFFFFYNRILRIFRNEGSGSVQWINCSHQEILNCWVVAALQLLRL